MVEWPRIRLKGFSMIRSYQGRVPQVPSNCYIDLSAQVIGDVTLGEHSSVWMNAVLRGDVHSVRVGSNSNVQDCAVLHGQRNLYSVTVGDWVTIGHNATVHGCVVEDECLIGIGARVLNHCHIGAGSIIAAGSVVPEHTVVPPRTLWAGVPAKMRRELSDKDRTLILEYAQNYVDYTAIYLNQPAT
jgi:carbonic anhydrase/acetyltransferase-like protein (isoleucine patch superfamily)